MDYTLEESQQKSAEEYNNQEDYYISKIKNSQNKISELETLLGEIEIELFQLQKIADIKRQDLDQGHPSWPRKNDLPLSVADLSTSIRDKRSKVSKIRKDLTEPIIYFMENVNNLKMLKDYINSDEYIKEHWYKILFYMRMNTKIEEDESNINISI